MVVAGRHQHDAVTQSDLFGALRAGGEEYLRRGGVRVFLKEVMLHLPNVIDAQPIGQFDLIERVLEQPQFKTVRPRTGELMFVEDAEFHRRSPRVQ